MKKPQNRYTESHIIVTKEEYEKQKEEYKKMFDGTSVISVEHWIQMYFTRKPEKGVH